MVVRVPAAASMRLPPRAAAIDRCDLKSISAYLCGPGQPCASQHTDVRS